MDFNLSIVSHYRSIQLLSNPSLSQTTATDGFVPLWIMNAPGYCAKQQKPVSYTFSTNINLAWLDLRITCRPPVIVSKWNPQSYCVSERWEAERSGHPDLSQSSVKVREQQGPAECWGPTAHVNMDSHNVHECTQTHRETHQHTILKYTHLPWHA